MLSPFEYPRLFTRDDHQLSVPSCSTFSLFSCQHFSERTTTDVFTHRIFPTHSGKYRTGVDRGVIFLLFFLGGETRIGDWPGIRSGLRIIQLLSVVVSFCMVKGYAFALLLSPPGIGIKADDQTSKYKKTNATKPPVR